MMKTSKLNQNRRLFFLGGQSQGGTYVLRMQVHRRVELAFGRFKRGKKIVVPSGDYLYVGRALGKRGSVCLARRSVRHASRTGSRKPHSIRGEMLAEFPLVELGTGDLTPRHGKRLRWNVDHLLDLPCVDLCAVYLIRSPRNVEAQLGRFLEHDPATVVIEPGLGANDIPGNTHLLRVEATEDWWRMLPRKLHRFLRALGCN